MQSEKGRLNRNYGRNRTLGKGKKGGQRCLGISIPLGIDAGGGLRHRRAAQKDRKAGKKIGVKLRAGSRGLGEPGRKSG